MAEQDNSPERLPRIDLALTDHEDLILMEDYLLVTDVKDDTPEGDGHSVSVEVRAENRYRSPGEQYWRSLRYQCLPEDAPRARDMIRVLVLKIDERSSPAKYAAPTTTGAPTEVTPTPSE